MEPEQQGQEQAPIHTDWGPVICGYRDNEVIGIITETIIDENRGLVHCQIAIGRKDFITIKKSFTADKVALLGILSEQKIITLKRSWIGCYDVVPEVFGVVTGIEIINRKIPYMLVTINTQIGNFRRRAFLHQISSKGHIVTGDVIKVGTGLFFPHLRIVDNTPKEAPAILEMVY